MGKKKKIQHSKMKVQQPKNRDARMSKANGFVRRIPKNVNGARGFKKNVKRLARSVLMRAQLTLNATMKKINGFVSGISRIVAGMHGFKKNVKRPVEGVL